MDTPMRLDPTLFSKIVEHAPLISIDLVVENEAGEALLGLRKNPPAQGMWFVPGGRVHKSERLDQALERVLQHELRLKLQTIQARFLGVYEHLYEENVFGDPGYGTHYVVLAHHLKLDLDVADLPKEQHESFRWWDQASLLGSDDVHVYTKAYFKDG
jgi:colanic acid biosynthesis protein WcaH